MQITRWRIFVPLLIAAILAVPSASSVAQTPLRLERLQVDFWPEYDRPEMLVIYRGLLPADTPLPATLTLRLPARVVAPFAVAYEKEPGSLLEAAYSTARSEDWLEITLETPQPNFQLEFYDALEGEADQRSYRFVWPGDYAVDQLSFLLLPPPGATQVRTQPPLSATQQAAGNTVYVGTVENLASEQQVTLQVSYRGAGSALDVDSSTTSDERDDDPLLVVVGGAVAVLLLVTAGWMWYTRRPGRRSAAGFYPQQRPKRSRRTDYCTRCGNPLDPDDRFCSQCGAAVDGG